MTGSGPTKQPRHLHSRDTLARAAATPRDVDLTRAHGQGNGLRVHGIYVAVVSLTVLVIALVAIAFASATM